MSGEEHVLHPNLRDVLESDVTDAGSLDAIARRLGELAPSDVAEPPPPGLFAAIEAELDAADGADAHAHGAVVELAPRRSRRPLLVALAAAAAVVVVVAVSAVLRDDDAAPVTEQVALAGLPDFADVSGSATVVIDGDRRSLGVDLSPVEVPPGSHLELWLLDESVEELVPLGLLADDAPHTIPPDVDLTATPIVDVSVEPDDGNPAHSGVSVARGRIEPT
jgi:anti-sigma-K factor RskA